MKCGAFILLLAATLTGCAANLQPQDIKLPSWTLSDNAVVGPGYNCHWPPGGYTDFLVVSSTDLNLPLAEWPLWLETDQTNFTFIANEAQRFFAICGTNQETGENAWAGSGG